MWNKDKFCFIINNSLYIFSFSDAIFAGYLSLCRHFGTLNLQLGTGVLLADRETAVDVDATALDGGILGQVNSIKIGGEADMLLVESSHVTTDQRVGKDIVDVGWNEGLDSWDEAARILLLSWDNLRWFESLGNIEKSWHSN